MTLYLIGLGLNERGISLHGKKILKNCAKIYLENYTVEFPYSKKELEKQLKIKVIGADREFVEGEEIVEEAVENDVALLVYGSPLSATTHISLINSCKEKKVKYKILHAGSVFDAVAESGLQLYKFGKTASIPKWQDNYKPVSFIDIIKDNQKIGAHTLLLVDIGLGFGEVLVQLGETGFDFGKVVVCSCLGVKSKFFYEKLDKINSSKVRSPFCIVVVGKLGYDEEENLNRLK